MARECARTIAGWRPRPRQARLPADKTWLTAARAAGLTPLAALIAVAHICPSHRARQTPLDGQGRRRSEWGFRRRRPARGSQRAASRPMYRRPPLKSSSIRRWHVSPDHWPPFLPSRAAVFSRRLHISPAGEPESPLGLSTIVATFALASSSWASSRRRFSASSPTTCSANRSAALIVSATRSASGGRDG